jgi:hypothetical protein
MKRTSSITVEWLILSQRSIPSFSGNGVSRRSVHEQSSGTSCIKLALFPGSQTPVWEPASGKLCFHTVRRPHRETAFREDACPNRVRARVASCLLHFLSRSRIPKCFPFLSTGGQAKWREPFGRGKTRMCRRAWVRQAI